jgi:hypothetical protein
MASTTIVLIVKVIILDVRVLRRNTKKNPHFWESSLHKTQEIDSLVLNQSTYKNLKVIIWSAQIRFYRLWKGIDQRHQGNPAKAKRSQKTPC